MAAILPAMLRAPLLARTHALTSTGPSARASRRSELVPLLAKVLVGGSLLLGCGGTREASPSVAPPNAAPPSGEQAVASELLIDDFTGPTAPLFHGRFDRSAKDGPYFAWSGSSITVRFEGTELSADLNESGDNRFAVIVDGVLRPQPVVPGRGVHTVELVTGLAPGEHTVTLYRLTEPLVGETQLLGFRVSAGGKMLPPPPAAERRLEVIGDSISTGYGNEGNDPTCGFSPGTQNHYETYGAITARALNAELNTLAWSGRGVFSNRGDTTNPMPELWRRTLPSRENLRWDFSQYAPQAVVINLGTNDFAPEVADTAPFAKAYSDFVAEVRSRYPEAQIFCAVGPMLTDSYPPGKQALTTVRAVVTDTVTKRREAGDARVHYLDFGNMRANEGLGCDYHPTIATQKRMAETLTATLRETLGW